MDKHSLEQLKLANVAGIIQAKDLLKFTRMVFRITKGNSILYTFDIPKEKDQKDDTPMTAFICVVETGGIVLTKLHRICDFCDTKMSNYKLEQNQQSIIKT